MTPMDPPGGGERVAVETPIPWIEQDLFTPAEVKALTFREFYVVLEKGVKYGLVNRH